LKKGAAFVGAFEYGKKFGKGSGDGEGVAVAGCKGDECCE